MKSLKRLPGGVGGGERREKEREGGGEGGEAEVDD